MRSIVYSSRFSTTVAEWSSQRGVGCTQVVKPPFVMRYFFAPVFWMVSPKKYTSVSAVSAWPAIEVVAAETEPNSPPASAADGPCRDVARVFCGPTGAMPRVVERAELRLESKSARSATMRLACETTTLPVAVIRF